MGGAATATAGPVTFVTYCVQLPHSKSDDRKLGQFTRFTLISHTGCDPPHEGAGALETSCSTANLSPPSTPTWLCPNPPMAPAPSCLSLRPFSLR